MSRWPPYSAYKASGVDWLGSIPAHWDVKRLKYVAAINSETLPEDVDPEWTLQYVDISNVDSLGRITDVQEMAFQDAPSRARRIVRHGDTILSTVRTYLKAIAFIPDPPENLIVSTGFAVLHPDSLIDPRFLSYLVRSQQFVDAVMAHSEGVSYPAINPTQLGCLAVWLPPLAEQRAIGAFLDCETAQIDALVAKKERLIALLQEKRTALISHAVTKGLDSTVPMKDSGIAWLGQIPAHWAVKRLKYMATVQAGVTLGKDYGGRETTTRPYLRVANVQDGYLDLETITDIAIPPDEARRHELRPGDVLMTEGGDFDKLGRGYVWEGQIPGCLHQNHIFAVRPMPQILNSHYLAALMTSFHGKSYFTSTSQQTTNLATTNRTKLRAFLLPLPPFPEQQRILAHLDRETKTLNDLIGTVREAMDRLQEYRTALISAAITGQITVQERAP